MTGWLPLQKEMTGLSTNSVQRVLPDATHASLTEDETEGPAALSRQSSTCVAAVRSGGSLTP